MESHPITSNRNAPLVDFVPEPPKFVINHCFILPASSKRVMYQILKRPTFSYRKLQWRYVVAQGHDVDQPDNIMVVYEDALSNAVSVEPPRYLPGYCFKHTDKHGESHICEVEEVVIYRQHTPDFDWANTWIYRVNLAGDCEMLTTYQIERLVHCG